MRIDVRSTHNHILLQPKLYDFNLYHLPRKDNFAADALSRRPDNVIANDNPSLSAQELKLQCSRTLQDTVNRLNVLRLPHQNLSLPTLHPLRTTNVAGDSEILALVKEEAQLDPEYLSVTTAAEKGQLPDFTEKDGLMWYTLDSEIQPRLCVPEGQARTQLIKEAHDSPIGGHLGVHKTHESRHHPLYWPKMFYTVHEYVRTCMQCLRNRSTNKRPMALLQPLPLPDHCWEQVSHDLVTGLPKTPRGYETMITFVDRLSKQILLVPTTSIIDAVGYARLFFHIFRHFGLSRVLVSDRPPLHIKLLESFMQTPWHQPQHVHISSPSNRRPNRTCQPHD